MQRPLLMLRADASTRRGSGHLMRCLALAAAWREARGEAVFAAAECPPALAARVAAAGYDVEAVSAPPGSVEDAAETAELARRLGAGWIAADGYHFGTAWQVEARRGATLLVFDDFGHASEWAAEVLLNQNSYARTTDYPADGPLLLLGGRYVLLRPEFARWRGWRRPEAAPGAVGKVLVTLGGTDPDNVTKTILEHLKVPAGWKVQAILGAANPHRSSLARFEEVELLIDPPDMAQRLASADVGIIAGGGTAWEAAFLGLPSVLVCLADNQRAVVRHLAALEVAVAVGDDHRAAGAAAVALALDPTRRGELTRRGQALIDGWGAARVVTALRGAGLRLRAARSEDARLVWELANEEAVRASSFRSEPIPWEEHQTWYERLLQTDSARLCLAFDPAGELLGQVRGQVGADGIVISVSLTPAARGLGYAAALIDAGCRTLQTALGSGTVHAFIKPENAASVAAFQRAGFAPAPPTEVSGQPALHYTRS